MKKTEEIIVFSFTRAGAEQNRRILKKLEEKKFSCAGYAAEKYVKTGQEISLLPFPEDIRKFIGERWGRCAFLFIGACGIAVRYIAPWVRDKFTDSPVLVMDEAGRHVIPLLSGHIGGAAALADEIAAMTGGTPVQTTATDVRGRFAVDVFAEKNGLVLTDRTAAKKISAAVLEGEKIGFCVYPLYTGSRKKIPEELVWCESPEELKDFAYEIVVWNPAAADPAAGPDVPDVLPTDLLCFPGHTRLLLLPGKVTVGIGCRRGASLESVEEGIEEILAESGLDLRCIEKAASIDLKKNEPALLEFSEKHKIPFITFCADELKTISCVTLRSEFVEAVTGVDNVCERAALACCPGGVLIRGKRKGRGMTAALAMSEMILKFDGEDGEREKNASLRPEEKTEKKILIFGGTTEGRLLAEYAEAERIPCYVSTATEYGENLMKEESLLKGGGTVQTLSGRMDEEEIGEFLREHGISLVVDATHPFAVNATENIRRGCRKAGVRYIRCLREETEGTGSTDSPSDQGRTGEKEANQEPGIVFVDSIGQAIEYLSTVEGGILITTGGKDLEAYTKLSGFKERCFARVLSTKEAVSHAAGLGFEGRNLIAMQGPFSYEMNLALLRQTGAKYLVTKESGSPGGFEEKIKAARDAGAVCVVIRRPREEGMGLREIKEVLSLIRQS